MESSTLASCFFKSDVLIPYSIPISTLISKTFFYRYVLMKISTCRLCDGQKHETYHFKLIFHDSASKKHDSASKKHDSIYVLPGRGKHTLISLFRPPTYIQDDLWTWVTYSSYVIFNNSSHKLISLFHSSSSHHS